MFTIVCVYNRLRVDVALVTEYIGQIVTNYRFDFMRLLFKVGI